MRPLVKVAFASGPEDLNRRLFEEMAALYPDLPLYVVSEFAPETGIWVPYDMGRSLKENLARCRAALAGKRIRLAGVLLVPQMPYRRMRLMALLLSPLGFLAFNENLNSFMLRPRSAGNILRHALWRGRNFLRWQLKPGGHMHTFLRRLRHPREWRLPLLEAGARAGLLRLARCGPAIVPAETAPDGISVVIPSRNGRELLAAQLPGILSQAPDEVIVVDNGSSDGSQEFLRRSYSGVVVAAESMPLSFARAVNRGLGLARYSHVCLLNNDMLIEPGFFAALRRAFDSVPDLFCASAQIFFPAGARREETGKTLMVQSSPDDFPVRCQEPLEGEDLTWVLYGSGGCSLYDAAKLRALGGVDESFEPAYVEDLDLGWRAWQHGWPTVFVAGARVEHRHRATTSRYYSDRELETVLEINYLRFLYRAVASPRLYRRLWRQAVRRLRARAEAGGAAAAEALAFAASASGNLWPRPAPESATEELVIALREVAVFPGRQVSSRGDPCVLVASPYVPFPLSHGGAVRIYNLMRAAAPRHSQILVAFCEHLETPPRELLDICSEIVLVRRRGSHALPSTSRPETVEEFCSGAFRMALRQAVRKWRPKIVQLEFTQMAQYAPDARPAKTILVEHDITFDLYQQLLALNGDWELKRQYERWRDFETAAWNQVDCVVTMSRKDSRMVTGTRVQVLPNGVDVQKFRPSAAEPEPNRLLFIGSFAHLPNLLALEFFLTQVWPKIEVAGPVLHIIAGARHEYYLSHYRDRTHPPLHLPGIELEGFVADVRAAYARAAVVVAPLVASAGTNIKILEAMAMGKAIVSTPAGINGLDLTSGRDLMVTSTPEAMAEVILRILGDKDGRRALEEQARKRVEREFNWISIGRMQDSLYGSA